MNSSRIERLIGQTEKLSSGHPEVAEVDDLLTACVAEMLTVRAKIRRLEDSSVALEQTVAELRALRNEVSTSRA